MKLSTRDITLQRMGCGLASGGSWVQGGVPGGSAREFGSCRMWVPVGGPQVNGDTAGKKVRDFSWPWARLHESWLSKEGAWLWSCTLPSHHGMCSPASVRVTDPKNGLQRQEERQKQSCLFRLGRRGVWWKSRSRAVTGSSLNCSMWVLLFLTDWVQGGGARFSQAMSVSFLVSLPGEFKFLQNSVYSLLQDLLRSRCPHLGNPIAMFP